MTNFAAVLNDLSGSFEGETNISPACAAIRC